MIKTEPKKNSPAIGAGQRCGICDTPLTLYPKGFQPCSHCQKKVCRRCWGEAWISKSFTAEKCVHSLESDGLAMPTIRQMDPLDWRKLAFWIGLSALGVGAIIFVFSLMV